MSTNLNKTKATRRGAIIALVITILMTGCSDPVGGVENNPLADFVGKTYKSQYGELFTIAATDTIKLGYGTDYNTTYYAPIHLVRCSLSYQYSQNLSFTMEGNNLLDQRYLYHDGYWGPSRSYTVKIKATF